MQLIGVLLIFVFVLALTYLTTRWMGGYTKAHSTNKNMKIVETIRVGNNKMISIIAVGKKYLVVSIGKDEVHLLSELEEDELLELPVEGAPVSMQGDFQEVFNKLKAKKPKKQDNHE